MFSDCSTLAHVPDALQTSIAMPQLLKMMMFGQGAAHWLIGSCAKSDFTALHQQHDIMASHV